MAGAFFNILIPTKHHEVHLSQRVTCDCSTKTKHPNKDAKTPFAHLSMSMEKVSPVIHIHYLLLCNYFFEKIAYRP